MEQRAAYTSVLVLHTPLFLLDVPETHSVIQAGGSEPFPIPREACGKYWTLIGVDKLQWCLYASQSSLLYASDFRNTARQRLCRYAR